MSDTEQTAAAPATPRSTKRAPVPAPEPVPVAAADAEVTATDEAPDATGAAPAEAVLFTEGSWNGLAHYECALCPFDTLHLDVMEGHLAEVHLPSPAPALQPPQASGLLVDRYGNPLVTNQTSTTPPTTETEA